MRAEQLRFTVDARGFVARFELVAPAGRCPVELALAGRHNVQNALAAIAVAGELGVPDAAVLKALVMHAGQPVRKDELFASVWKGTIVSDDAHPLATSQENWLREKRTTSSWRR